MSTKIYNAYRCELKFLSQAIEYLRERMWKNVLKEAQAHPYYGPPTIQAVESFGEDIGECGFHVWLYGGYAYIILFGHSKLVEFKKTPAWLEDYKYWNNTDKTKNVSQREWDLRGKMWRIAATDSDRWEERLTNVVFSNKDYLTKFKLLDTMQRKVR